MAPLNPRKGNLDAIRKVSMAPLHPNFSRTATRRLSKAVTLLFRAGKQLDAASRTAPDKYNADRLRFFATGLRDVTLPLHRIASRLQKGGE